MSAFPVDHDVRVRDVDNALSGDGQHGGRLARMGGPLRNQRMLHEGKPDLVVVFPGGGGTKDMVRRAVKAGVAIHEVNRADDW